MLCPRIPSRQPATGGPTRRGPAPRWPGKALPTVLLGIAIAMMAPADRAGAQGLDCSGAAGLHRSYCDSLDRGDFVAAQKFAAAIRAGANPESIDYAEALFAEAKALLALGQNVRARDLLVQAAEMLDRSGLTGSALRRQSLEPEVQAKLGEVLNRIGDCANAVRHLNRAVDLWSATAGTGANKSLIERNVAVPLNSLALIHMAFRRLDLAEAGYQAAIGSAEAAARRIPAAWRDVAVYRANRVRLYQIQERNRDMLDEAYRALGIQQNTLRLRPQDADYVQTFVGLAAALREVPGRAGEGVPYLEAALRLAEGPQGRPALVAGVLVAFGNTNRALGRLQEADRQLGRALAIRERVYGPQHHLLAAVLGYAARVKLELGDITTALELSRRATEIAASRFHGPTPTCSEDISSYRQHFEQRLDILDRAIEKRQAPQQADNESFFSAQWAVGSTAAAAVARMAQRFIGGGADAATVRNRQDDAMKRFELEKRLYAARLKQSRNREEERRLAAAIDRLGASLVTFDHLVGANPITADEARALVNPDEVMVFHLVGKVRTYLFAVTREDFRRVSIPIGDAALDKLVGDLRRDFERQSGTKPTFDLAKAHRLYQMLLGPVADLLAKKPRILIVPTGPLTAMPYHLLVTRQPPVAVPDVQTIADYRKYAAADWLIKSHVTTVLPSVDSLKALRGLVHSAAASKALVGFGDPTFQRPDGETPAQYGANAGRHGQTRGIRTTRAGINLDQLSSQLPRLPETKDELVKVSQSLDRTTSDLYLEERATETAVKRTQLSDYRVVYFATHGLAAGQFNLSEPAVVMALPAVPTDEDDGLLTATEVAQLRLNADWVVLSACNTASRAGRSKAAGAQGDDALSGLARSFFYAGARSLLVTHWEVDSKAATYVMTRSFELLSKQPRLTRSDALRAAMLEQMNDPNDPEAADPKIWGPFQLIGIDGRRR